MSETMVGSAGLTVSALARRLVLAQTRCAITSERSSSGRRTVRRSRGRYGLVCGTSTVARLVPPHELTAAIDLALFNARWHANLPVFNRFEIDSPTPLGGDAPVLPRPDADGFETSFWPSLLISGDLSVPMCWHGDRSSPKPSIGR